MLVNDLFVMNELFHGDWNSNKIVDRIGKILAGQTEFYKLFSYFVTGKPSMEELPSLRNALINATRIIAEMRKELTEAYAYASLYAYYQLYYL